MFSLSACTADQQLHLSGYNYNESVRAKNRKNKFKERWLLPPLRLGHLTMATATNTAPESTAQTPATAAVTHTTVGPKSTEEEQSLQALR